MLEMFPSEEAASRWLEKVRWPEGPVCPHCGRSNVAEKANRKPATFRCRGCRQFFSLRHSSVMECSRTPLCKWPIAVYLCGEFPKGVSSLQLHRALGITQKSAWFMAHRLRETWTAEGGLFSGPVEVDETYMGAKRKNMPKSKHKKLKGRGKVGKTAIVGAKDRATN